MSARATSTSNASGAKRRRVATGRDVQAAQRREQLLAVALKLFCENGYAGTSTRRIAEAAGVTEGLVFHYFPTKEALLFEIAARQQTFAGRVFTVVQQAGDSTARDVFQAIAGGLAGVSSEELAFIGFMMAESQVNPLLRSMVTTANAVMFDAVRALLQKRVDSGELRTDASLSALATGFFGGFFYFFNQHQHLAPAAWRREAAAFAEAWADQCWRGAATSKAIARADRTKT